VIHDVPGRLAEVLSTQPGRVLPSASIADRRPGAAGDLPALALSIDIERSDQLGLSRLVRASELLPDGSRVREDLRGLLVAGTVTFEVWASQSGAAAQLSRAVDLKLRAEQGALRERGFAVLRPSALEALEGVRHDAGVAAPFNAWRQRLAYRFALEWIEGGELSEGGRIDRIDVDLVEQEGESFSAA
jgi:hypothetical protein